MRKFSPILVILAAAVVPALVLAEIFPAAGFRGDLALASPPGTADLAEDTAVVLRRVYKGPVLGWGSEPSPDGRYVTVIADAGSLGRIDLLTGDILPIKNKGTWSEAAEWVETTSFSRDGRQVAYVYGTSGGYEVRIADVDGSNERVLVPGDPQFYAVLGPWVGNEILASWYRNEEVGYEIVALSPEDGSLRDVFAFPPDRRDQRLETPLAISPDGRFFTFGERGPDGSADVVVARTRDGSEAGRITGPANDIAVAWTPDGEDLLFHSDRLTTEGIWRVSMTEGAVAGEPMLVRGDLWNFEDVGPSRDAYFFSVTTDVPRVRVAGFDPEIGGLTSEPFAASEVSAGMTRLPLWSPDGTALAYVKRGPQTYTGLDQSILVVRSLHGPEVREIPLPGVSVRGLGAWTSDGRIIAIGKGPNGWGVWSIELQSGVAEALVSDARGTVGAMPRAISSDGGTGFFLREDAIVARDLVTGAERRVVDRASAGVFERGPYPSPDGETMAMIMAGPDRARTCVVTVPVAGGAVRQVFCREAPGGISQSMGVFWDASGDRLFFSTHSVPQTGEPTRLWMAEISGQEPLISELEGVAALKGAGDLVVSPDGSRIAFVAGEREGELWMMTNLSRSAH